MALTVVIIVLMMLVLLGGYILTLAYNHYRLQQSVGGQRMAAYYRARAGVVDAQWRIRRDPGGLFAAGGPAYNPSAYSLDIDDDGVNDVTVDISEVIDSVSASADSGGNTRRIDAVGRE
jgi:hypothetical protein